ncbi:MAG: hypothetical protein KC731_08775, partial [Myxococcales bacterium]|nr:hypothetical protein [Myxococcales bacterium]
GINITAPAVGPPPGLSSSPNHQGVGHYSEPGPLAPSDGSPPDRSNLIYVVMAMAGVIGLLLALLLWALFFR